ncbi:MAG: baseplate J/gp47 family protein [Nitrospirota bacterium]|nr:baseplate J/gp47 family protein [Nitrospirota bacterium]
MPFTRPTLTDIKNRVLADIEAQLPGADARLRRTVLNILGTALAGAVHGIYGYTQHLAGQILPDTAETDYLERWASLWGISRTAAAKASGSVTFTGTNGTLIPVGTTVQRADGAEFVTAADVTIAAGSATATVTAAVAGADGNTAAASSLTLTAPIAGVNSTATTPTGLSGGADAETDAALRNRLVTRLRQPPHGGTQEDYIMWAREVAGVTRVWCLAATPAAGQATVLFARDNDAGSIIPDAGEITAVQTYINGKRPVTAAITVAAPTAVTVNFTIALVPATAAVKAAVEAELRDLVLQQAEPGATLYLMWINEAISRAAGESNHTLTAPAADVVLGAQQLGVFGAITWA